MCVKNEQILEICFYNTTLSGDPVAFISFYIVLNTSSQIFYLRHILLSNVIKSYELTQIVTETISTALLPSKYPL